MLQKKNTWRMLTIPLKGNRTPPNKISSHNSSYCSGKTLKFFFFQNAQEFPFIANNLVEPHMAFTFAKDNEGKEQIILMYSKDLML